MTAKLIRSEEDECIALVEYLDILKRQKKITAYTHVPNSTYTTSWNQKSKNKKLGVAPGFPDYIILGNRMIIFLEMKRTTGGVLSLEQKNWLELLSAYHLSIGIVAKGFNQAKNQLDALLFQPNSK